MSNSLDSDPAQNFVRPDLGPNFLQRFEKNQQTTKGNLRMQRANSFLVSSDFCCLQIGIQVIDNIFLKS